MLAWTGLRYFSTDARTVQHTAMSGKVGQDFTRSQQPGSPGAAWREHRTLNTQCDRCVMAARDALVMSANGTKQPIDVTQGVVGLLGYS